MRHNVRAYLSVCFYFQYRPLEETEGSRQRLEETYKLKTLTSPRQDGKGKETRICIAPCRDHMHF